MNHKPHMLGIDNVMFIVADLDASIHSDVPTPDGLIAAAALHHAGRPRLRSGRSR